MLLTKSAANSAKFPLLLVLGVLALVALVFARALAGELVYDDLLLIGANPTLTSLSNLPDAFGRGYWDFLAPGEAISIGYWRPLPAVMHLLAWRLSGESVAALHAVSLVAHLIATLAAARLAWTLVPSRNICLVAGALFGLHPLHVESVAWISALNDPLFGAFSMLALASFAVWRARGSNGWALGAAIWFALALLSKEMGAAVLPLVVVIDLARTSQPGTNRFTALGERTLQAFGPLLAVFVAYVGVRMVVFGSVFAGFDRVTTDFGVPLARLALLRVELIGRGAELLALPLNLQLFRRFHPDLGWADSDGWRAIASCAVLLGLALVGWGRRRSDTPFSAALFVPLWIVASLAPVLLRVESLGRFPISDRFYYLSVFALALGLPVLLKRLISERGMLIAGALAAIWFGFSSFQRTADWNNERALFASEVESAPRSVYARWGLGRVQLETYQRTQDRKDLDAAIATYEAAQDLLVEAKRPGSDLFVGARDFLQVGLGYGWTQLFAAQSEGFRGSSAATYLFEELAQEISQVRANEARARELGIRVASEFLEVDQVHNALGVSYLFEGRLDSARATLRAALQANPNLAEAHQNLGRVAAVSAQPRQALKHFEDALALRPNNLEDALLVAQTRFELGQTARAANAARELLEQHPKSAPLHLLLAAAALAEGDGAEGLRQLDLTLGLDPTNAQAHYLRGTALAARDRRADALVSFRRALELDARHFEAAHDLAALLLDEGAHEAARDPLMRAFELAPDRDRSAQLRSILMQFEWQDAALLFQLAGIDSSRGELDAAEFWLDRGLHIAPDDPGLLFQRGRILRERKRDEEAVAAMRRSLSFADSFVARSELGHYLLELVQLDAARAELERALELSPPADWPDAKQAGALERVREKLAELDG